ncbi:hypothetical protein TNCV_2772261 [Trichonephila clavipes]|nr:hypothetical protein TNCV_2772261 [Trichonephila clavipes]
MPYSGFEPELTGLQAEGHIHLTERRLTDKRVKKNSVSHIKRRPYAKRLILGHVLIKKLNRQRYLKAKALLHWQAHICCRRILFTDEKTFDAQEPYKHLE